MTSPADSSVPAKVAMLGATGRMGLEIIKLLESSGSDAALVGASAGNQHARLGQPLNRRIRLSTDADALLDANVAIDFSLPKAVQGHVASCAEHGVPYVCGVTGLNEAAMASLEKASQNIAVLWAPNMSIGVNLCLAAAAAIAAGLRSEFDVAILDIHHAGKRDAPSGTALEFGRHIEAVAQPRRIKYDSIREDSHPGEHHIRFSQIDEVIEIRHRAGSRREFALGAVRAACWLKDRPPGFYNMQNLLGIASSA